MIQRLISFLVLALFSYHLIAQQNEISGVIKDANNQPVPGVSVYIKSTSQGTSTNANGIFSLKNYPNQKFTLMVSGIGWVTIEQEIDPKENNSNLSLSLEESISKLNQVEVISGGSKGIKDIPGSVQYITPKELDRFKYTDINRALRTVPGINIQEEDGFGLRPNIGMRATGVERSSKITLMEDGILIAPAPYVAPAAYYFPTMGRMEGIEVMKGHSQIKYGPYTTGGSLNLISSGIPDEFSGKVNVMIGSYGTKTLHVNIGNAHKRVAYMLETFQYGSDGFKQLDGGGNTGFEKTDYLGKVRINTGENAKIYQSLTLKAGTTTEDANETYLGLTEDDFEQNPLRRYAGSQMDNMKSDHWQVSLTHVAQLTSRTILSTSIYYNDFHRNWYKLDNVTDTSGKSSSISSILDNPDDFSRSYSLITGANSTSGEELNVKANNRSYFSSGIQSNLKQSFQTLKVKHILEIGFRYHIDQMDRFQWVDGYVMNNGKMQLNSSGEHGTESNRIESAKAIASFIQYSIKINMWSIHPGLRYEHIDLHRTDYGKSDAERTGINMTESDNVVEVFLPGLGVDFRPTESSSVFAGYHKGFAPPGTKEGTNPEQSDNFELGYRLNRNTLTIQTVAFFNNYQNLLGADLNAAGGTGSNDLYNGGKAQSYGLEFQLGYDLMSGWKSSKVNLPVNISYTYSEATFLSDFDSEFEGWGSVSTGDELPYLANNQLGLLIGVEYNILSFFANGKYMDAMRTAPGQGPIPENEKTDAYFVTDLTLNVKLQPNISVYSNVSNLTDETYIVARRPAGLRPGMPRTYSLGFKANF